MLYSKEIEHLIEKIDNHLLDINTERKKSSPPTQVSSEFLTNKEQGDWAELTLLKGINRTSEKYIAVKYGKNDTIIAGDEGFKEFYNQYQDELDSIGKRPDLLIFKKEDFHYNTNDISELPINELDLLVPKALCGIEVRSSAFLMNKYETFMEERNTLLAEQAFNIQHYILENYAALLKEKDEALYDIIHSIDENNMHAISYRVPSWKSSVQLAELSNYLKKLKEKITSINKRTFLSITPKVEDLKVVYNWIEKYNVPHFYVQVFFDKAYGISYKKILSLLSKPELENKKYFIEGDIKNQNKLTIKIKANDEARILDKITLPNHHSEMRELGRGRLLFYVKFDDSLSVINKSEFNHLFGEELE